MNIVCSKCGTKNRVLAERLADGPKCGQCGTPLAPSDPVPLSGNALGHYVAGTEMPVVVDFWAEWCGPCKMMAPEFAKAARERPDIRFIKVDTEEAPQASATYGIRSIPTLGLFRGGKEVARVSGAMSAAQLLGWIDQHLPG